MILAGVRALTIHDQKAVEVRDLSAQFYLTEEDVGHNRAEACKERLQDLNNAVDVSASSAQLTPDYLEQFQVGGGRGWWWGPMRSGGGACLIAPPQQQPFLTIAGAGSNACMYTTAVQMLSCRWWC